MTNLASLWLCELISLTDNNNQGSVLQFIGMDIGT